MEKFISKDKWSFVWKKFQKRMIFLKRIARLRDLARVEKKT